MSGMTDDEIEMSNEISELMGKQRDYRVHVQALLEYCYEDEKKDFEETFGVVVNDKRQAFNVEQNKHIFYNLYRLKGML